MFCEPPDPPAPQAHPVITEVLYAVPTEKAAKGDMARCDASGDGSRDATGDEFVEIFNPHDTPIELKGYVLSDSAAEKKPEKGARQAPAFRFVFPALTLRPGEVVVVFNGNRQKWTGPVGDQSKAPAARHDRFDNAWVFTAQARSSRAGFSNSADFVVLSAPDGTPVERVKWGADPGTPVAKEAPLVEEAPTSTVASVQRRGVRGEFVVHTEIDGLPFSPGRFRVDPAAGGEPAPAPGTPARPASPSPSAK